VLASVKEVLLEYHLAKYLRAEPRSAPFLDPRTHPHGWSKGDCARCHEMAPTANFQECARCHGSNGLAPEPENCQTCHRTAREDGAPNDRVHAAHLASRSREVRCASCHPAQTGNTHANGIRDVRLESGEYTAAVAGAPAATCANSVCHEERTWQVEACAGCHGYPPTTGAHVVHLKANGTMRGDMFCESCHAGYRHESGTVDIAGFDAYDALSGTCTASCHESVVRAVGAPPKRVESWGCADCHAYPPDSGNHRVGAHGNDCATCHTGHRHSDAGVRSPGRYENVEVAFSGGGSFQQKTCVGVCHEAIAWGDTCTRCHGLPPNTGDHAVHVVQSAMSCKECHAGNAHDLDDRSGVVEVRGDFEYNPFTGECGTSCHKDAPVKAWKCGSCHAYPPETGAHVAHSAPKGLYWKLDEVVRRAGVPLAAAGGLRCQTCHQNHQHTFRAAMSPTDFSQTQAQLAQGTFSVATARCETACHDSFSWRERCADCHDTPPQTGDHAVHTDERARAQGLACGDCHDGIRHAVDVLAPVGHVSGEGAVNVGGMQYDALTGTCTSSCHRQENGAEEARAWTCAPCHGSPPLTGAHVEHQDYELACRLCHVSHQHGTSAVMQPVRVMRATVQFVQSGEYDREARSCASIGCHRNDLWRSKAERGNGP
jgi:hypothetical protein